MSTGILTAFCSQEESLELSLFHAALQTGVCLPQVVTVIKKVAV